MSEPTPIPETDDTPTEGQPEDQDPTGTPPESWDPGTHTTAYESDPEVDTADGEGRFGDPS